MVFTKSLVFIFDKVIASFKAVSGQPHSHISYPAGKPQKEQGPVLGKWKQGGLKFKVSLYTMRP